MNSKQDPSQAVGCSRPRCMRIREGNLSRVFKKVFLQNKPAFQSILSKTMKWFLIRVLFGAYICKTIPHGQAKLIRVVQGRIYDVAVDLRADSSTYGEWFGVELSAENQTQLFLPKGFAHGYSVLSERAIVQYKVDAPYNPQAESGIRYNDPDLGIDWQVGNPKLSEKDQKLPFLKDLNP